MTKKLFRNFRNISQNMECIKTTRNRYSLRIRIKNVLGAFRNISIFSINTRSFYVVLIRIEIKKLFQKFWKNSIFGKFGCFNTECIFNKRNRNILSLGGIVEASPILKRKTVAQKRKFQNLEIPT